MKSYEEERKKMYRDIVKKEADKIRKQVKGGRLYGLPIEEFGEDGVIFAASLLGEMRRSKDDENALYPIG